MFNDLNIPSFKVLEKSFFDFFVLREYKMQLNSNVTDVGKDKSTRFVGSVTNIFKPQYQSMLLQSSKYFLVQDCLKTFNLNKNNVRRCSYYPAFGSHAPIKDAEKAVWDLYDLLIEEFKLPSTLIETHVASYDDDLITWCSKSCSKIKIDQLHEDRYKHSFGDGAIKGRNTVVFLNDRTCARKRKFIATSVVISIDGRDWYLETTINPLAIIQYMERKESEFDIFPLPRGIEQVSEASRNKFFDSLIVSTLLFRTGLLPTNKNNQTRLFKKYVLRLIENNTFSTNDLSLSKLISDYERKLFETPLISNENLKILCKFA